MINFKPDPKKPSTKICKCGKKAGANGLCPNCTWKEMIKRSDTKAITTKKDKANTDAVKKIVEADDLQVLVKKLDGVFSQYVRLKNADVNGMVKCFVTGYIGLWNGKEIQSGHFQSRRHYATRWDEINVQPQSRASNIFNQGAQIQFGQKIDERYGKGTALRLQQQTQNKFKLDKFKLQLLVNEYTDKLNELKAEHGIL